MMEHQEIPITKIHEAEESYAQLGEKRVTEERSDSTSGLQTRPSTITPNTTLCSANVFGSR